MLHFVVQQKLTAETNTTLYSNYPPIKKRILREMKKDIEKVKEVMCEENETRQISNQQPNFTTEGTRKKSKLKGKHSIAYLLTTSALLSFTSNTSHSISSLPFEVLLSCS